MFPKFVTLLLGAVLTTGLRTISQVVRVVGELADADPSSYHRVLSMRRWFPARQFVYAGDGGDANHLLTRFARHHQKRLTLVSRFSADAALYAPPPRPKKNAKPRSFFL